MLNQENHNKFYNSFVLGIDADDTLWENEAWFYKIKISDKAEFDALMDADAYKAHAEA